MSKHTEGPWQARSGGRVFAPEAQDVLVCRVGAYGDPDLLAVAGERWKADAKMIAAAPAMLAVLERLMGGPLSLNELNELMTDAAEVVAKAKGGE